MLFKEDYKRKKKLKTLKITTRKPKKWIVIDTELLANNTDGIYKFDNFTNLSKKELKQLQKAIKRLIK